MSSSRLIGLEFFSLSGPASRFVLLLRVSHPRTIYGMDNANESPAPFGVWRFCGALATVTCHGAGGPGRGVAPGKVAVGTEDETGHERPDRDR